MTSMPLVLRGEAIVLDARRALWWPARRWLLVADLHLGKASALRRAGSAVPEATIGDELARLSDAVDAYRPARLVVLGDLVHARDSSSAPWRREWQAWCARQAALEIVVVAGNHDAHALVAADTPALVERIDAPPFTLVHAAVDMPGGCVIAGHLHPGVRVRDGRLATRVPAFWIGEHRLLLPAFGSLCGLAAREPPPSERAVAVMPGGLLALPYARA